MFLKYQPEGNFSEQPEEIFGKHVQINFYCLYRLTIAVQYACYNKSLIAVSQHVVCLCTPSKTHKYVCMIVCMVLKNLTFFGSLDIADFLTGSGDKFKIDT